jgi:pimeloyl-ACP methyl ester carboxylesterase
MLAIISAQIQNHKGEGQVPYADNAGIRIHYEVEGTGPALVLQHGIMQSVEDWFECGYVAALRARYRLILVDARGHGQSDKPHDGASYALASRVADVVAVIDAVDVERAHFWGYSMGGLFGFGMAKYAPKRINALVIGGQHPYARNQEALRQMIRQGVSGGSDAFVAAFEKAEGPISDTYAARLRTGDFEAYLAMVLDRGSMEDMLGTMAMPCCMYAGEADPAFSQALSASERIPNSRFFSLPGLTHMQTFVESEKVVPQVVEFLDAAT